MSDDYFASIKDGIRGLGENIQQLSFMNALSSANDRVRELKGTVKNDVELRQKVYEVTDQMSRYMLSNGMDAPKIESMLRSLGVPQFKTAQEQAIYSAQRGDKVGLAQAASADVAGSAGEAKIASANNATQLKVAQMKLVGDMAGTQAGRILPHDAIKEINVIDKSLLQAGDVLRSFKEDKSLVGLFSGQGGTREWYDPKYATFKSSVNRWADAYRKEITGAGASDTEREELKANMPNGKEPSAAVFQAKVEKLIEIGQRVKTKSLQNYGKAGYNISGFSEQSSGPNNSSDSSSLKKYRRK